MDKVEKEILELETKIDKLWNITLENINQIGEWTKRLTVIKLTQRLRDEEKKNRQI